MTVKKVIVGNGCTAKAVLKERLASPARQVLLTDKVNDMYYEEKLINGILMCRTKPDGDWRQCSIEKMGERIAELENTIIDLKDCLRTCANSAQDGLDQYSTGETCVSKILLIGSSEAKDGKRKRFYFDKCLNEYQVEHGSHGGEKIIASGLAVEELENVYNEL